MDSGKTKMLLQQARILGRVERLMGNGCDVNPYPTTSQLWVAFHEGWSRALDDPISRELTNSTKKQRSLDYPTTDRAVAATDRDRMARREGHSDNTASKKKHHGIASSVAQRGTR